MKHPAAYYLLLIYLFAWCRPVLPLLQDIWAHTFAEQQHLAAVHCHAGSSHVKKETGKFAAEQSNTPASGQRGYDEIPQHLPVGILIQFNEFREPAILNDLYLSVYFPLVSLTVPLPPPWQSDVVYKYV